jgi:hypothetical protein
VQLDTCSLPTAMQTMVAEIGRCEAHAPRTRLSPPLKVSALHRQILMPASVSCARDFLPSESNL